MVRVAINAGHHPKLDWGACNHKYNLHEADVARSIALDVIAFLNSAGGYACLFIQENSLQVVCNKSDDFDADLFVSIHCDSVDNPEPNGTTTYIYKFGGQADLLAHCVQKQIVDKLKTNDRGVRLANYTVLTDTDAPAILIECGYVSNEHDVQLLINPTTRKEFARAIALGITDYIKNYG